MRFKEILSNNSRILTQLSQHGFNRQLLNGTLPPWKFKGFIEQDKLYLLGHSQALRLVSKRFPTKDKAQQLRQLSEEIKSTEMKLLQKYLGQFPVATFFSCKAVTPVKIPIIAKYTEYLLHYAKEGPLDEAVVSLSACYCIYRDMGERNNLEKLDPRNPYRKWLDSYSSKQFLKSTQLIMDIADELIEPVTDDIHMKRINLAFQRSAEYELNFFEESLSRNQQQIVSEQSIYNKVVFK